MIGDIDERGGERESWSEREREEEIGHRRKRR